MAKARKRKQAPEPPQVASAGKTLDILVQQFSQPLAFLRELTQNALDAGANLVEVTVTYDREEKLACLKVADSGEGMDRQVIDEKLTRLFASSKDNDLTKIGKFGIGFVSVFSLKPRAVVVDTGRNGESWRILFHADRTFDRIRRETAWDGTTVSVYHALPESAFPKLLKDSRETMGYWCRHCTTPIYFNGEPINRPLSLGLPFEVELEQAGSRVVVGCADEETFGFYNQGLTLHEGRGACPGAPAALQGFSFKVSSRYLEHTLTRDSVVRDASFARVMGLAAEAAGQHYPRRLLGEVCGAPTPQLWQALAAWARLRPDSAELLKAPLFPTWNGQPASLRRLELQLEPVCHASEGDALLEKTLRLDKPPVVLQGGPDSPWWPLLTGFLQQPPAPLAAAYVVAEEEPEESWSDLLRHLQTHLRPFGFQRIFAGRWRAREQDAPLAAPYGTPGQPQRRSEGGENLLLDVEHPGFQRLGRISSYDRSLAWTLLLHRCLAELELPRTEKTYLGALETALKLRP